VLPDVDHRLGPLDEKIGKGQGLRCGVGFHRGGVTERERSDDSRCGCG
jgi:hypothetical protein